LRLAEEIAFSHHERWDGSGCEGTVGDAIPLAGHRGHRRRVRRPDAETSGTAAWPIGDAVAEIERQRNRQFDPAIVDACRVIDRTPQIS
jgi:putative two-component system response regulator